MEEVQNDFFSELPEGFVAEALALTSPRDACRLSSINSFFRSAANWDKVWESFTPPECLGAEGGCNSKKDTFLRLCDHPVIIGDGNKMSDDANQNTPDVFQNPLYLRPSDGPSSITVQEMFIGSQSYRAWRRAIEIGLSTKRKFGFIRVSQLLGLLWLVILQVWSQLEKRFALSDGSRKYKLNKDRYDINQFGGSVSDYFTKMKCVWEELDSVNVLPSITMTPEISLFLTALNQQKRSKCCFSFLMD
ncbi:hypothetical protein CTI12_AA541250 [Artemisia annua]|uniref:F-box domain, cyclin-like protein n=1 Tax=Artemisia annua TaxID=35608 RepID=A0A2U1L1N8_ARTAN|nr:hypothetical protein CTI12_AA541250 [Artemisia annua]